MDLGDLRRQYGQERVLSRQLLPENPLELFALWMQEAKAAKQIEPNAMALVTSTKKGVPSVRMVLLKFYDEKGFSFFTNLDSRKSKELRENPKAALNFYWGRLSRQVTIEGTAHALSSEDAEAYFARRPRESQIAAWASKQGAEISDRKALLQRFHEQNCIFEGHKVAKPPFWGGFTIKPWRYEFWQGRDHRLHDRFDYLDKGGTWFVKRLSP